MRKQIKDFATKKIKDTIMSTGSNDRAKHAETVIRNHVIWSMGASFIIPIPIADVFAVSALQLDMIRQLSRVYEVDFAETQGKAIVTSLTSSTLARAGARSLLKLIPGIGTVIGGVTVSVFNGASTYALGEVFKRHFDSGGTILDFDTERLRKIYKEKFEKGKKVVQDWKVETDQTAAPNPATKQTESSANQGDQADKKGTPITDTAAGSVMDKIKELSALREAGMITEEEFVEMKRKLIADM